MNTKAYITPRIRIFNAEMEDALLTMSIYEKEIDDNYGLAKESNDDWDDIWDE